MDQPSAHKIGLRFDKIVKRYGAVYALRNVDLTIAAGECVALAGRNGSGKTTLLRIASRLTRPTRGAISFSGIAGNGNPQAGFVAHKCLVFEGFRWRGSQKQVGSLVFAPKPDIWLHLRP